MSIIQAQSIDINDRLILEAMTKYLDLMSSDNGHK